MAVPGHPDQSLNREWHRGLALLKDGDPLRGNNAAAITASNATCTPSFVTLLCQRGLVRQRGPICRGGLSASMSALVALRLAVTCRERPGSDRTALGTLLRDPRTHAETLSHE